MTRPAVTTRRLERDVVIAVVDWRDLAEFKAQRGLRTIGGYWPDHSAQPILFVEPIPPTDPKETQP